MKKVEKMMNIAIDARMINASGIGRYLENVIERLIPSHPKWTFYLLGSKAIMLQYNFSAHPNVRFIYCQEAIYSIGEQTELYKKIPENIDLFWSPHYNIPVLYRGKLLVTIHDVFHLAMPEFVGGIHKRLYAKMMFYLATKKATKIICVSTFTAEELKRLTAVKEKKLQVIYNGVDEAWFQIKKQKLPHHQPYLLYVGNIKPHKNLVKLLKAFQLVQHKIPHNLLLVGRKEGFITGDTHIAEIAKELDERVVFTGYVSDDRLKQYVVHAETLVFPSLYEGFGLPPIEAMACGCPVIVSNVAAMPEICGENAVYCDPKDEKDIAEKIMLVVDDEGLKRKMREAGIAYARRFSWEVCADAVGKIIEKTTNSE